MKYLCFFLISWSSFGQIPLNDLILWVKADSGVTYSLDNRVSEWVSSNSNNSLIQSSNNNKPTYLENVQSLMINQVFSLMEIVGYLLIFYLNMNNQILFLSYTITEEQGIPFRGFLMGFKMEVEILYHGLQESEQLLVIQVSTL